MNVLDYSLYRIKIAEGFTPMVSFITSSGPSLSEMWDPTNPNFKRPGGAAPPKSFNWGKLGATLGAGGGLAAGLVGLVAYLKYNHDRRRNKKQ